MVGGDLALGGYLLDGHLVVIKIANDGSRLLLQLGKAVFKPSKISFGKAVIALACFRDVLEHSIAEVKRMPLSFLQKRQALEIGDSEGPRIEAIRSFELANLVENDAIALLQHIFGIRWVRY